MKLNWTINAVLASTVLLGACVTDSHAVKLAEQDGRIGFEQTRIADRQDSVMSTVASRFSATARCSSTKTGMVNSWKALSMEECRIPLAAGELVYAGVDVETMNLRFIDGRLLQLEMVFSNTSEIQSSGRAVADEVSEYVNTDLQLAVTESRESYRSWHGSKDLVELENGSSLSLRISDARLVKTVLALAE